MAEWNYLTLDTLLLSMKSAALLTSLRGSVSFSPAPIAAMHAYLHVKCSSGKTICTRKAY